MHNHLLAGLAAAALFGSAFADVTAVWRNDRGDEIVVRHADDDNFSMMTRDDRGREGGGVIVKDGRAYAVSGSGSDAQVFDMEAVAEAMKSSGVGSMISSMMSRREEKRGQASAVGALTKTGRTESHAGISGEVYVVTDERGREQEIVLTRDAKVRAATRAMMLAGVKMSESMGKMGFMRMPEVVTPKLREMMKKDEGGLLRSSDMTLASVDGSALPRGALDLPAEPQSMPDMGAMFEPN